MTVSTYWIAVEIVVMLPAATLPCVPAFCACTVTCALVTPAGMMYAFAAAL
nr:hypothetical protein [Paraburkholderia sp. SOS3]